MSLIEQKASEVAGFMRDSKDSPVEHAVAFDPLTILTIVSVIIKVIQIWKQCNATPAVACDGFKQEGSTALSRLQLRKEIRIKAQEHPRGERRDFRISMEDAVYKMGGNLNVADMQTMFEEAEAANA